MARLTWRNLPLNDRVRWLRYVLPPILATIVIVYKLGVAQTLARDYGHVVHYGVEIAFYSLGGPGGTWITLVWVERRLLEQIRLERQVQVRTQQLVSLTDVSADAILSLDARGLVASWNKGAERIFGYPQAEILRKPLSTLLPEAPNLRHMGTVQDYETAAHAKDGRTLSVGLTQTQLTASDESMPVSLIIMRDITSRREREAILEEERARIARDLHDGVAQNLYFLALKADMARQQITPDPEQATINLREIGQKARQVIREVRRTIFALGPLAWSDGGFLPALRQFVTGFAEQVGWQTDLEIDESLSLPHRLEPTVFRLVQESLNNVAKHAEATHVWVNLCAEETGRSFVLTVRDNGSGFDPSAVSRDGLGLGQMEARVSAVGGAFHLDGQPGKGTSVTAQLPGDNHA
jgi:PAS domain S-box-containing protein